MGRLPAGPRRRLTDSGATVVLAGATRRFGSAVAVDDVSFDARPGEVLGLLGPNGAGKTTTMRMITGYLKPTTGRVHVNGSDPSVDPDARRSIGYVPEATAIYRDLSVSAYLRFCARLRGVPRGRAGTAIGNALRHAGLQGRGPQRISTLSRGLQQRVAIAQALVHEPDVLILDEPTTALDPRQVTETRGLIARLARSRTVILSSHLLSEVSQLCKRVVVLDRGRVVTVADVAELTTRGGPTRLELRVRGDSRTAAAALTGVDGVTTADGRGGGTVVIEGTGADLPSRVAAAAVAAGVELLELRTVSAGTLEEAYLRLVAD